MHYKNCKIKKKKKKKYRYVQVTQYDFCLSGTPVDSSTALQTLTQDAERDPEGNQQQDRLCVQTGLPLLKSRGRLIFRSHRKFNSLTQSFR